MFKSKENSIRKRIQRQIKKAGSDLSAMEQKAMEHTSNYLDWLVKTEGLPVDKLTIRISKPYRDIRVTVYDAGRLVKAIPVGELIRFFSGGIVLPGMHDYFTNKISCLLELTSNRHDLNLERLEIWISKPNGQLQVNVYDQQSQVSAIAVKEFIQFFS